MPVMKSISPVVYLLVGSFSLVRAPVVAAEKSAGTGPSFKGPLGLQLYSLRGEFTKNVPSRLIDSIRRA